MEFLGEHYKRKVYWWKFSESTFDELPSGNWIGFAIEDGLPDYNLFDKFAKVSIAKGILEFKAFGKLSSKLDDWFDEIVVIMNVMENQPDIFVMTTWHDKESLANAFWQSFSATCLPDSTDYDHLKIICTHFDNVDKKEELKTYIKKFNEGWLPEE